MKPVLLDTNIVSFILKYEGHGRGWITLDGQEIANFSEIEYEYAHGKITEELQQINDCTDYTNPEEQEGYYLSHEQAHSVDSGIGHV